jgi:hypothetical protein
MDLQEIGLEDVDWIHSIQDKDHGGIFGIE